MQDSKNGVNYYKLLAHLVCLIFNLYHSTKRYCFKNILQQIWSYELDWTCYKTKFLTEERQWLLTSQWFWVIMFQFLEQKKRLRLQRSKYSNFLDGLKPVWVLIQIRILAILANPRLNVTISNNFFYMARYFYELYPIQLTRTQNDLALTQNDLKYDN